MATYGQNHLKQGVAYTAFCSASDQQAYKFTFDGDEEELVKTLREKFGADRSIAMDCGDRWRDDQQHQGAEVFSKLSLLLRETLESGCIWDEPEMMCWEDTTGENLIIITPGKK